MGPLLNHTAIARIEQAGVSAILPELHPPAALPEGPHGEPRAGRHHHGTAGETHRTDRIHHDRLDAGMEDRPPRRHGVTGGAGGGGDDQAITAVLIHHLAINLELKQTGGRHLIKAGPEVKVVEGAVGPIGIHIGSGEGCTGADGSGGAHPIAPLDASLEHHAALQGEAIGKQPLPKRRFDGVLVGEPQEAALMGEKSQVPPHIETEDRHPMGGEVTGRAEHGAIAPEHQGEIGRSRFGGQQGREGILGKAASGHDHTNALGS